MVWGRVGKVDEDVMEFWDLGNDFDLSVGS